jgi:hypothetical protein
MFLGRVMAMFALADRMSDSDAAGYLAAQGKDFGLTPTETFERVGNVSAHG